jgi:hypothetical protein
MFEITYAVGGALRLLPGLAKGPEVDRQGRHPQEHDHAPSHQHEHRPALLVMKAMAN